MRLEFGRIPTIPLRSTQNVWGRVKYCTRPRGESNVAVDSDSESETDYDMGSGSEMSDNDYSEGVESDGYATP